MKEAKMPCNPCGQGGLAHQMCQLPFIKDEWLEANDLANRRPKVKKLD